MSVTCVVAVHVLGAGRPPRYVENLLGLLDGAREWFVDPDARALYFLPNATATDDDGPPQGDFVAPLLEALIEVRGYRLRAP